MPTKLSLFLTWTNTHRKKHGYINKISHCQPLLSVWIWICVCVCSPLVENNKWVWLNYFFSIFLSSVVIIISRLSYIVPHNDVEKISFTFNPVYLTNFHFALQVVTEMFIFHIKHRKVQLIQLEDVISESMVNDI